MERPIDSRNRLMLVLVPNDSMVDVLNGRLPVGLPADARMVRGFYNKDMRTFQYVIRSMEFAEVSSDDSLPVWGQKSSL